jgi:hypothetical protein
MRKVFVLLFSFLFLFTFRSCVFAENDPTGVANNKFGIHITDERDLKDAATLVNSSGGDWGYVTFVIRESERDHDRWQQVFDQMRRAHLIPIVRIATKADGDMWIAPQDAEINNWVAFLNSLNWVTQNRYVVIGNEPNHASEWGGRVDPVSYATYLDSFAQELHRASSDFFVLPAGLDASAKTGKDTMDEAVFIKKMFSSDPNLFDNLDGWTSHSYPNPDFSGSPGDSGRGSIKTFDWELSFLKSLGVNKQLPVFITETGWSNQKVDPMTIADKYGYAFQNVWSDKQVIAVTPFILNYPNPPFAEFSWKESDGSFYPYFDGYRNIQKVAGAPVQYESGQILGALAQPVMFTGADFIGAILVKNTGQSIWDTTNVHLASDNGELIFKNGLLFDIEPTKTGLVIFRATPSQRSGLLLKSIYITNSKDRRITNSFPIESLIFKLNKVQVQSFFDKLLQLLKLS